MRKNENDFHSPAREWLIRFVQEQRALGFRYVGSALAYLRALDHFFLDESPKFPVMDQNQYERFVALRPGESSEHQRRMASRWKAFARFLNRHGKNVFVPESCEMPIFRQDFVPYIYTRAQIAALFNAADSLPATSRPQSAWLHSVMKMLLRILYGTGMRVGETLALACEDFDSESGVITVQSGKGQKKRTIPLAPGLADLLTRWKNERLTKGQGLFFPSPRIAGAVSHAALLCLFRNQLLPMAGLPPRLTRKGPRLHDLRHTFAVHRMENWFKAGEDIEAKLPYLAAFMGHTHLRDTYYYLRITMSFFPEIGRRLQSRGVHFPEGGRP